MPGNFLSHQWTFDFCLNLQARSIVFGSVGGGHSYTAWYTYNFNPILHFHSFCFTPPQKGGGGNFMIFQFDFILGIQHIMMVQ